MYIAHVLSVWFELTEVWIFASTNAALETNNSFTYVHVREAFFEHIFRSCDSGNHRTIFTMVQLELDFHNGTVLSLNLWIFEWYSPPSNPPSATGAPRQGARPTPPHGTPWHRPATEDKAHQEVRPQGKTQTGSGWSASASCCCRAWIWWCWGELLSVY